MTRLGLALDLDAAVVRSDRPARCSRCGRRRVLFSVELALRPRPGAVVPGIQPGVTYLASPPVCADCAAIRRRAGDEGDGPAEPDPAPPAAGSDLRGDL